MEVRYVGKKQLNCFCCNIFIYFHLMRSACKKRFYRKCKSKPYSGLQAVNECQVYFAKTTRMLVTCLMQRAGFFSS